MPNVQIIVQVDEFDKLAGQKKAREQGTTLSTLIARLLRQEVAITASTPTSGRRRQKAS